MSQTKDWSLLSEEEKITRFNIVLDRYREKGFKHVKPCQVIPDTTNRGNTGLSGNHAHYIACKMSDEGFSPRKGNGPSARGHDLPLLVREGFDTVNGRESWRKWKHQIDMEPGVFATPSGGRSRFFTSLGNGHFFAALNLFDSNASCLWDRSRIYTVGSDVHLRSALRNGVRSIVLRRDIPRRERRFLSEVLNSSFTFSWDVATDGSARITHAPKLSDHKGEVSQFEALSKSLDSFELDALITQHRRLEAKRRGRSKL